MRKLFQFSIAALFGLSLVFVAASAFGQDAAPSYKISGYVEAGIGQITPAVGDGFLASTWDSQLKLAGGSGAVKANLAYRWRPRGESIYHQVAWAPTGGLSVVFGNMTIGETAPEVHRNGLEVSTGDTGDAHDAGIHATLTTGAPNLQIRYQAGPVNVGVAIVDRSCRPSCDNDAGTIAADGNALTPEGDQTMIILARGAFGPVSFEFANFTGSGTDDLGADITGVGMHLGGKYKMGTMTIMFDYVSTTAGKADALTATALAFEGFSTFFRYASSETKTAMTIQYYMSPGKGMTVYPEYITASDSSADTTETVMRLVAKTVF